MFRYAYCGYAPYAGHARRSLREAWKSHAQYSWHAGPTLGVRRPLRYLAYKLDLDDAQLRELADILDRLKTARAQADVDGRRTTSDIAGALEPGEFDEAAARSALDARGRSQETLRSETLDVLKRLHRLLDPEQRRELAYLVRSGTVSF
ncbi:MAG: Spy/CpxP family protein refolding chaperone [Pseudomonadales bacterium]